jgi:hypothetical protein
MSLKFPDKDPDEVLDYSVDWSRYLDTDTISSVTWKIDDNGTLNTWVDAEVVNGLQRVSASNNDTVATIQLSLGTAYEDYDIYCEITTSSGTTTQRKIKLRVRDQT